MKKLILLVTALAGCSPAGYYVAHLYADQAGLIVQSCAIDNGQRDAPDPSNCRFERVGPPPPEVAARLPPAPEMTPAMAMPPTPPEPPTPPTPPAPPAPPTP